MFKIGEFSKMVRVSARMLRYYEQCGLLFPAETDRFTGYRLYSAGQIQPLLRIVELRDMGFGVEEIKEILPRYTDAKFMRDVLDRKRREVQNVIADEKDKLKKIAAKRGSLDKECVNMVYEVEIKSLPSDKVLALREIIPAYNAEGMLWEKLGKFVADKKIPCGTYGYSIFHDAEYKESSVDVEIAVPVPELGESQNCFVYKELEPIPQAATVRFSGPYSGGYDAALEKLAGWIEKNGYEINGLIRGLAIKCYPDVKSEDDLLTEIQVPVKKV